MIKRLLRILIPCLLFVISCAKENLLSSDTSASQKDVFDIAEEEGLIGISITAGEGGWISLSLTKPSRFFKYQSVQDRARLGTFLPPAKIEGSASRYNTRKLGCMSDSEKKGSKMTN